MSNGSFAHLPGTRGRERGLCGAPAEPGLGPLPTPARATRSCQRLPPTSIGGKRAPCICWSRWPPAAVWCGCKPFTNGFPSKAGARARSCELLATPQTTAQPARPRSDPRVSAPRRLRVAKLSLAQAPNTLISTGT